MEARSSIVTSRPSCHAVRHCLNKARVQLIHLFLLVLDLAKKALEQLHFQREEANDLSHALTLEVSIHSGRPATPLWTTRAVSAPRILWL